MKVQSLIHHNEDIEQEDGYWYTAKDGRKVFVNNNESPLEAYNRMYPENRLTRYNDDSEPFDEDDNEDLFDHNVSYVRTLRDDEKEILTNKILDIHNENINFFNSLLLPGASGYYEIKRVKKELKDYPEIYNLDDSDLADYIREVISKNL